MHTAKGLIDLHARTHTCLSGLIDHCASFSDAELREELTGFGYPTILLQLHHAVGAEQYWLGVLRGLMLVDEDEEDRASIDAIRAFRQRVAEQTIAWLGASTEIELNAPREVLAWGDKRVTVVPANVVIRTQTHVFQHQGQVTAMCRLLGRPVPPGLDFPLT